MSEQDILKVRAHDVVVRPIYSASVLLANQVGPN